MLKDSIRAVILLQMVFPSKESQCLFKKVTSNFNQHLHQKPPIQLLKSKAAFIRVKTSQEIMSTAKQHSSCKFQQIKTLSGLPGWIFLFSYQGHDLTFRQFLVFNLFLLDLSYCDSCFYLLVHLQEQLHAKCTRKKTLASYCSYLLLFFFFP